ncbi:MAG TPA: ATP-binding protein [Capsulimonadaceae bacterium]|jgi:PAS domain S-box-containing protein
MDHKPNYARDSIGIVCEFSPDQSEAVDELARLATRTCRGVMAFVAVRRGGSIAIAAQQGVKPETLSHAAFTLVSHLDSHRADTNLRIYDGRSLLGDASIGTVIAIPILLNNSDPIGVLCVGLATGGELSEGQRDSLAVIGRQIGRLLDAWDLDIADASLPVPIDPHLSPESGNFFRRILDAMPDLVLVKGPGSRILWANRAFCEYYGMTPSELRSLIDAPFVEPDYTLQYVLDDARVFETGEVLDIPVEPVTSGSGVVRSFHTIKAPICDPQGTVLFSVGTSRDITDQREVEEANQQAVRLDALGRLAAGIAHEVNTPIQFIGDNLHFLKQSFSELAELLEACRRLNDFPDPSIAPSLIKSLAEVAAKVDVGYVVDEVPHALDESLSGISTVARLVSAMKEYSSPRDAETASVDLNRAIENAVLISKNEWRYVAEVELALDTHMPFVPGYAGMLNQALVNMIVNAANAISDVNQRGAGHLGRIRITSSFDDHWSIIRISDNGSGIPQAIRHRIFDPFFTTREVGTGCGQGLAVVHTIIARKHGGKIDVESQVGEGTTFTIRLPRATTA